MQNAMSESNSKEFKAVLLGMKLSALAQEKHERMLCEILAALGIKSADEEEDEEEEGGAGGEGGGDSEGGGSDKGSAKVSCT